MCGIVAMVSSDGPVPADALCRATAALSHRGPDATGQWLAPHGRAGLGHTRLSIVDLVTGGQPMANEDGTLHLVVNGEFYGFEAIRAALEAKGHRFTSRSDSEIALHLYEEHGNDFVHHLRGEFAMALWDDRRGVLIAARDRCGVKPLHWAANGSRLWLASEAKALFAAGLPARWDHLSLFQCLHLVAAPDRTLFDGVRQLPPGHLLVARGTDVRISPYWHWPAGGRNARAWVPAVREALDDAVRVRLRADVPVGCYLSGGVDSCAVLALAARHGAASLDAFTLCFGDPAFNEEHRAAAMASEVGARFHAVRAGERELAAAFPDAVRHAETLASNAHGAAKYLLSRSVRDAGLKVVLTGEGADEVFAGYEQFRRDVVPRDAPPAPGDLPTNAVRKRLGFVPSWIANRAHKAVWDRSLLRADFLRDCADPFASFLDALGTVAPSPLECSTSLWARSILPNYILTVLGDRMEMAHSVEGRLPFLDHRLVELAAAAPASWKIRGTTGKFLLREAVRDMLPSDVSRQRKHPFFSPPPFADVGGAFKRLLRERLGDFREQPFYEPSAVEALLDRLPALRGTQQAAAAEALLRALSVVVLESCYRPR